MVQLSIAGTYEVDGAVMRTVSRQSVGKVLETLTVVFIDYHRFFSRSRPLTAMIERQADTREDRGGPGT